MTDPSAYVTLPIFEETGYVVLDSYDQAQDPREWEDLTFVDWKSSGDTRFAPLASAYGDMECNGFWNHTPPKTDKDGVWVPANVEVAPRLVARAAGAGQQHRPLPGHRAAAEHLRRRALQPAPRRQQPPEPRGHRLDRPRLLQPDGQPRLVDGAARGPRRPLDRDPHPAAGRRPGHHRHAAAVARGVASRPRSALLPHHVVGVRPRARGVHRGEERPTAVRHRRLWIPRWPPRARPTRSAGATSGRRRSPRAAPIRPSATAASPPGLPWRSSPRPEPGDPAASADPARADPDAHRRT